MYIDLLYKFACSRARRRTYELNTESPSKLNYPQGLPFSRSAINDDEVCNVKSFFKIFMYDL